MCKGSGRQLVAEEMWTKCGRAPGVAEDGGRHLKGTSCVVMPGEGLWCG